MTLHEALAVRILPVVLSNVTTRYPYHDTHLSTANDKPRDPAVAHPAFGNSYDWHSSAHSHWTAVQLVEYFAARSPERQETVTQLAAAVVDHLSAKKLDVETAYLKAHRSYERPYGWAWATMLAAAVHGAKHAPLRGCAHAFDAMTEWLGEAAIAWMNVLSEPVRHGMHANTAFSLGLMHDAARALELDALHRTIEDRARVWFANDEAWPERWERSGHDFLSPGLTEADLMRRVLQREEFAAWWRAFLPAVAPDDPILTPVTVPAVADGQIVHLHGLNLSRAAALARIAAALGEATLLDAARRLYDASADRAVDGDYLATHWLATFAWDAAQAIDRAGVSLA
jgi:hypothetical protein